MTTHPGFGQRPSRQPARRAILPLACAVATLLLASVAAMLTAFTAQAHHPGSHAWRQSGTERVRLEAVAMAGDACLFIGSVTPGAPDGHVAPPDAFAVTARLRRSGEGASCPAGPKVLKDESMVSIPKLTRFLHVFVLKPDSILQSTERVPIK